MKFTMNRKHPAQSTFEVYAARRSTTIDRSDGWEDWAREFVQGTRRNNDDGAAAVIPSSMVLSRLLNA